MTSPRPTARVTRSINASPEVVFDAWIDPTTLTEWMFGPKVRDEELVHLRADPKVGGQFSFLVRRQGHEIDHIGTYRSVDRPKTLSFTWGVVGDSVDESVVRIQIEPTDSGCQLSLAHEMDPKWAEYIGRTEAGWKKMTDLLANWAETR